MQTETLPILNHEQGIELLNQADGRAVSFLAVNPQGWSWPTKVTWVRSESGMESHALASYWGDKLRDLADAQWRLETKQRDLAEAEAKYSKSANKPRVRKNLSWEIGILNQDIRNLQKRIEDTRRHFAGFMDRFLLGGTR